MKAKDLEGSILDKPDYINGFQENSDHFDSEFSSLRSMAPGDTGWIKALSFFEIYKGKEGYRIALPTKWFPVCVNGYELFENYLLSRTIFPNRFQASKAASNIIMREIGY
ncbi:MAG TPA: hypothetical protein VE954_35865 [Oligoflexus sp.]|uniref:hypothetical protein n=1 Tax=Oligoflexus sp. TaxID=1971216 RepID=UPI002D27A119|nr:hypothetical protein [Oligoflexus sp.]HYX38510.1 hypothetical protein [Oligoflexus sp.]